MPAVAPAASPSPPAAAGEGLGAQAFRGAAWTLGASLGAKVVALLGQVLVAKLLLPRDFGAVGLAYTTLLQTCFPAGANFPGGTVATG